MSVLSHETFESITDPIPDGWVNSTSNALYGEEIGDECTFNRVPATSGTSMLLVPALGAGITPCNANTTTTSRVYGSALELAVGRRRAGTLIPPFCFAAQEPEQNV